MSDRPSDALSNADSRAGEQRGLRPITPKQRLVLLDVLRGVALLGVLISNLKFHRSGPMLHPTVTASWPVDHTALGVVGALVEGKFYPLFSLLFGYGAFVMSRRAQARDGHFPIRFTRRMVGLMALGILHGVFVFDGDILFTYGLLGLFLLLFVRLSVATLWKVAVACVAVQVAITASGMGFNVPVDPVRLADTSGRYSVDLYFRAVLTVLQPVSAFYVGWLILAMFALGVALAKTGWLEADSPAARRCLAIMRGPLLVIGLAFAVPGGWWQETDTGSMHNLGGALNIVGGPILALSIVGWTAAWLRARPRGGVIRRHLQAMGRMSMTAYLLQSLIAFALFSPVAGGLSQRLAYMPSLLICVVMFMVIAVLCRQWLARFRFGPAEWLLRSFTYATRQPMRVPKRSPLL